MVNKLYFSLQTTIHHVVYFRAFDGYITRKIRPLASGVNEIRSTVRRSIKSTMSDICEEIPTLPEGIIW